MHRLLTRARTQSFLFLFSLCGFSLLATDLAEARSVFPDNARPSAFACEVHECLGRLLFDSQFQAAVLTLSNRHSRHDRLSFHAERFALVAVGRAWKLFEM